MFHPNEAGVEVIHSEPETGGKYRFSATGSGGGVSFLQEKITNVRIKAMDMRLILFIITNFFHPCLILAELNEFIEFRFCRITLKKGRMTNVGQLQK